MSRNWWQAGLVLGAVMAAAAFTPAIREQHAPALGAGGARQQAGPPACPSFALTDTLVAITVLPAGGSFPLGNGTVLEFGAGAVTANATYQVRPVRQQDGARARLAGFSITPQGSAPTEFAEPVSIRISYAGCPWQNGNRPLWLVTDRGNGWERIGGARSRSGRYVQAFVDHFSSFAIAQ